MAVFLLLALIGVPLLEVAVFVAVGERIGLWPILGLVVATAAAGAALLRSQGMAALAQAQESLKRREFPVAQVFDGVCLLVAGALLLTPGFVTDALGFLLFIPPLRAALRQALWRSLAARGEVRVWTGAEETGPGRARTRRPPVIEGDFHEIRPDDDAGPGSDGRGPDS